MSAPVFGNVWLGRVPRQSEALGFSAAIDMTGEMIAPKGAGVEVMAFPLLDLAAPNAEVLREAADAIEAAQAKGKALVCCALGMQRSAAAVGVWLVRAGHARNGAEALAILRESGRPIHLDAAQMDAALEQTA